MPFRRLALGVFLTLFVHLVSNPSGYAGDEAGEARKIRIGYFEGGKYPYHDRLRDEFLKQLTAILPDSIEAVFAPEGYRSANWEKENSGRMAQELALVKGLDLVVAIGPWVVHDLLNAGYKKPIVAMHQFAPQYDGLLDKSGKPAAENLTIHVHRDKLEKDLTRLAGMIDLKRVGFLYFPSANETDSVLAQARAIGEKLGFEVVTAEGTSAKGTYAYFNAFNKLDKKIDALYLPPLWGLEVQMLNQFFYNADHERIPVMTSEDRNLVERGAFLTNNAYDIFSEARFNAYKTAQIILGKTPADLPVEYSGGTAVAVNEAAALKCRITLPRKLYYESEVVLAPPSDDVPVITLSEAIARAVTFNPGYQAKKEAVAAAIAEASRAYAEYLPHLSVDAAIGYRDDHYVNNSRNELKNEFYVTRLNLNQRIFSLETIKSIQIASKKKDLEEKSLMEAQLDLEQAVTKSYLNYLKAQEILDIQFRVRQLIERNIEVSGARYVVESGSEYEFSRWRAEREKATQDIVDAQSNLIVARILLNVLINYPTGQKLVLQKDAFNNETIGRIYAQIFQNLSKLSAAEILGEKVMAHASDNNPQLIQFKQELEIQKMLLSKNKSRLFPTLDFQATLKHADELLDMPPPFKEEKDSWTLGAFFKLPLFDGSDRGREKRALEAGFSRLEFERDKQKLELAGQAQISVEHLIAAIDKLPAVNRRLDLSRFNLDLAVAEYDAGRLNNFNLLDEMNEIESAQLDELRTRYDVFEIMSDITHQMGWPAYGTGSQFTERIEKLVNEK